MSRSTRRVLALLGALTLVAGACGDDDDATDDTGATGATGAEPESTEGADATAPGATAGDGETPGTTSDAAGDEGDEGDGGGAGPGWEVDDEDCVDPERIHEPIEGTVRVASSGPQSGGPAAAAWAPVIQGFQTYFAYVNENDPLPGHEIEVSVGDDQYDPALTPGVISAELDAGAHLVAGIVGTPNNKAVRDTLNEECVPQLAAGSGDPAWRDVANYPWTTGAVLAYDVEAKAYAEHLGGEFGDGATVAVYYVNNDAGAAFKDGLEEVAGEFGIEIVDEQTIEAPDTAPPSAQVSSIAGDAPDAILAFPLGAQCPVFLSEIANAKAANPGWEPRIYLTSTCADALILEVAGAAADGLYTTTNNGLVDLENEENHDIPGVAAYLEKMESLGLSDTIPTSAKGWNYAEITVAVLRQAAESPEGLTQASIINAARNFEFTPSMARDGVAYKMSGEEDGDIFEDVQILQYDAETRLMTDVGELITTFRSS